MLAAYLLHKKSLDLDNILYKFSADVFLKILLDYDFDLVVTLIMQ